MNRAGVTGHLEPCTVSPALPQGSLCDLEEVLRFHRDSVSSSRMGYLPPPPPRQDDLRLVAGKFK